MKSVRLLLLVLFPICLLTACASPSQTTTQAQGHAAARTAPDAAQPAPYPEQKSASATAAQMISPATSY